MRQFFQTLALTAEEPEKTWLENFVAGADAARVAQADRQIGADPLLRTSTRNTIVPVILEAGFRINVIPGTDAGAWRNRGVPAHGIYPRPIDQDDLSRRHGKHNLPEFPRRFCGTCEAPLYPFSRKCTPMLAK